MKILAIFSRGFIFSYLVWISSNFIILSEKMPYEVFYDTIANVWTILIAIVCGILSVYVIERYSVENLPDKEKK